MKYRFMDGQRGIHRVERMAGVLGVSRSGYYAWQDRGESARDRVNRDLAEAIRGIQEKVKYRYGSPRVTEELRRAGMAVGHNRVARLMAHNGLQSRTKRRFRCTTKAAEGRPVAENLLARNFEVSRANAVWASDVTYIATSEGWLYLAVVLDLCSRRVVGWSMSSRLTTDLVLRAFWMAVLNRNPPEGLMFHSDRGSQYTSKAFCKALESRRMIQSMSRKGNCWDNAPSEAFFATLKTELMDGKAFSGRRAAQAAIFEYMEVFYNRQRLHSSLGYLTPVEYEEAISRGVVKYHSLRKDAL
ncbi:MAG: IS3 family transposase [Dehalococcoidia bacterium]|jgi:transposase InsO family protein|nr:IS3 family transposase [Dehalococcoidia bacterium]